MSLRETIRREREKFIHDVRLLLFLLILAIIAVGIMVIYWGMRMPPALSPTENFLITYVSLALLVLLIMGIEIGWINQKVDTIIKYIDNNNTRGNYKNDNPTRA